MSPSEKTPRVLLVDDQRYTIVVLQAMLRGLCDTVAEDSLQAALDRLTREGVERFEAVVTDHHMPGGDGIELAALIRKMDPTLAIILLTAEAQRHAAAAATGAVFSVLNKGTSIPETRARIEAAIDETARRRRELRSQAV